MTKRKSKKQVDEDFRINLLFSIVVAFLLALLVVTCFMIKETKDKSSEEAAPQQLTPKQITSLLKLGVIKIQENIKPNSKDIFTKIVMTKGDTFCYLYQDIFGRYYCRWEK